MKYLFTMLLMTSLIACDSSKNSIVDNKEETTEATIDENGYLVGKAIKSDFLKEPFSTWFIPKYESYTPNQKVIDSIRPLLGAITIKSFMGTWCGDSKREIPRFYKIIEAIGFKTSDLEMITVNKKKVSPGNEQEGLNIKYVPTFIFYKNGKELNRVVESVQGSSLEADILTILKEKDYTHKCR